MHYPGFNSFIMMVSLLLILSGAHLIIHIKLKNITSSLQEELRLRLKSWWWIISIILISLLFGPMGNLLLWAFVSFLALKEFYSIIPIRQVDRRLVFWTYLAIPIQYYLASIQWYGVFIIFIPVYMFLFLPFRAIIIGETEGFIKSNAIIQWSLMLCVFSISHVAYLAYYQTHNHPTIDFSGVVLFLLFCTGFNDFSQYLCGKLWGKKKLLPKVSPNKTWAGLIGGVIITALVATGLAPFLTQLSYFHGFLAGFIIALGGFVGDAMFSCIKRDLNIKDSGTLLPGHGGILDRIDSLVFTSPLFFHYFYYLN